MTCVALVAAAMLTACANQPPTPDWQLSAKGALERSVQAYLQGNSKIEAIEFAAARAALARTGRADLLARAELTRCAARVASLVFESCAGFTPLASDAGEQQRAYNDYLAGALKTADAALLPDQHRVFVSDKVPNAASLAALQTMSDPLARLVAASVLLQTGRAEPGVLNVAVDTASAQGWSRPLLAWLQAQLIRAEANSDAAQIDMLRRRIALVLGSPPPPPPPPPPRP